MPTFTPIAILILVTKELLIAALLAAPGLVCAEQCAERRLTDASANKNNEHGYYYPRFLKSGDSLVFAGDDNREDEGMLRLYALGLNGGEPRSYAKAPMSLELFEDNPDVYEGRCAQGLCVDDTRESNETYPPALKVIDQKTRKATILKIGRGQHMSPVITPDGKRMVFSYMENSDEGYSLMIANIDGSDPKILVNGGTTWMAGISPDGKLAAYAKGAHGMDSKKSDIYVICLP